VPTATAGYFTLNGTKIPSVTAITGRYKESGGLLWWAFGEGKRAMTENEPGRGLYDSKPAADIGTLAHAMLQSWIHGNLGMVARPDLMSAEDYAKAEAAFQSYLTWERQSKLRVLQTEIPLVSEKHRYGGTLDAIGEIDGEICLPDWKTSNALYTDGLLQVAGYGELWNETHPDQPLTGGYHLIRFSKDFGDFDHKYFGDLKDALELFLLYRRAYDLDKALKRRAA